MADDPEILRVIDTLEGWTSEIVRRIAVEVTAELIERTPVDTGWARANWVPNIAFPYEGTPVSVMSREDRTAGLGNAQGQQSAGVATLVAGQYTIERGPVFISNNVPYVTILNTGSSSQAPSGFIQLAIEQGIRNVATPRQPRR